MPSTKMILAATAVLSDLGHVATAITCRHAHLVDSVSTRQQAIEHGVWVSLDLIVRAGPEKAEELAEEVHTAASRHRRDLMGGVVTDRTGLSPDQQRLSFAFPLASMPRSGPSVSRRATAKSRAAARRGSDHANLTCV
jgi:hypothetical protein